MKHRFFVPAEQISNYKVNFTEGQSKQIRNVLRLRPGDSAAVFDGSGQEYAVRLDVLDGGRALGTIVEVTSPTTEAKVRLTLVQSMPKGEKTDLILQKCTEIGVAEFVLVESARTITRTPTEKAKRKLERWQSIVKEAAEQSGRVCLPNVRGIIPFQQGLTLARDSDAAFIAWEEKRGPTLSSQLPCLQSVSRVALLIGPEGGFTEEEIAAAEEQGIVPVSLGPRILRTETAAIVSSAQLIYGLESS